MDIMEVKYCMALHILTDFKLRAPPYHYIVPELVRVRIKFSFQLFVAWYFLVTLLSRMRVCKQDNLCINSKPLNIQKEEQQSAKRVRKFRQPIGR
jgi:hypothetical protein